MRPGPALEKQVRAQHVRSRTAGARLSRSQRSTAPAQRPAGSSTHLSHTQAWQVRPASPPRPPAPASLQPQQALTMIKGAKKSARRLISQEVTMRSIQME